MKRFVGTVLIFIGILLFVFLIFRDGFSFLFSPAGKSTNATAEVSDIGVIEIKSKRTNVEIIGEDRDNIYAELQGSKRMHLDANERGGKLSLSVKHRGFPFFSFFDDQKLVVHVPEEYDETLSAELSSGNLSLHSDSGLRFDQLSLETDSGNISVDRTDAEELSVKGSSGNIELSNINTSNSNLRTTSGNMDIKNLTGEIHSKLTSGNVSVRLKEVTDDLQFQLTSGKLNVSLPERADLELEANATSGNISHSYDFDQINVDDNKFTASKGKGTHHLFISVTSGNVEIEDQ
jgi:lia operon protein LiaG